MTRLDRLLALPRFADAGAAAYHPGLDRMRALLDGDGPPRAGRAERPRRRDERQGLDVVDGRGYRDRVGPARRAAHVAAPAPPRRADARRRRAGAGRRGWTTRPSATPTCSRASGRAFSRPRRPSPSSASPRRPSTSPWSRSGWAGGSTRRTCCAPRVAVVTSVGLDHTDLLGDTLAAIAREKAGIAKPGVPCSMRSTMPARGRPSSDDRRGGRARRGRPRDVPRPSRVPDCRRASRRRAGLRAPRARPAGRAPGVERCARRARLRDRPARSGACAVAQARRRRPLSGLRGRGETVGGVALDVAHNADGWRVALGRAAPAGRLFAVVGIMADKDAGALARLLAEAGAVALPVGLPGDRALGRGALADVLRRGGVKTRRGGGDSRPRRSSGRRRTARRATGCW